MDWSVSFRWAGPRQPQKPEPLVFAAGARPCASPRSAETATRPQHRRRAACRMFRDSIRMTHSTEHPRRTNAPLSSAHGFSVCGFTLLELMITVAIIAVLAAIALSSYRNAVIRGNRSAAKQFMSNISNHQEQYLLDQRSYASNYGSGGLGMTPAAEASANYTFSIATAGNDCLANALPSPAPAYVITGTAIGAQAGDGNLCLDSVGNKMPTAKWNN
jgi:type IV pilus assembly protein PilE